MESTEQVTTEKLPLEEQAQQEIQPTTSVKNFWERLDDVFLQNNQLRQTMQDLVESFPEFERAKGMNISSVFQPDRIVINSKDKLQDTIGIQNFSEVETILGNQSYTSLRIKLQKALVNVKSVQLLSAIIPVPQTSLPASERTFLIYKIRNIVNSSTGAWNGATNYVRFDIVTFGGNYYYLNRDWNVFIGAWTPNSLYNPTDVVTYGGNYYYCNFSNTSSVNFPPTSQQQIPNTSDLIWTLVSNPLTTNPAQNPFFWNKIGATGTFDATPNYLDLANPTNMHYIQLAELIITPPQDVQPLPNNDIAYNRIFSDYQDLVDTLNLAATVATQTDIPNELTFVFNALYNRIQVYPTTPSAFFYLPVGFNDANISVNQQYVTAYPTQYQPMNVRLGFTWNGNIPGFTQGTWPVSYNPFQNDVLFNLVNYMFPYIIQPANIWQNYTTFNQIPDLLYSPAVSIYCDFTQGSTQDSAGNGNLLSVVPLNTQQFGVSFYQNNFNNPLSKVPQVITEINIRMLTDKGLPYYLPNQATVLLELAIDYK